MLGIPFVVDENPHICWDHDLEAKNLEFLQGIDARYFQYVVESNMHQLDGDDKHRAALSIRLAYSQSLETLFALLASVIQAPKCPVGWMLAYRTELRAIVEKVTNGTPMLACGSAPFITWEVLSNGVHSRMDCSAEKRAWIQEGFRDCWSRFASDYLNQRFQAEYNSMKHGMGGSLGGFSVLSVGDEGSAGVPATEDSMKVVGGSVFGTSFFEKEKVELAAFNFRPRRCHRNWNPENMLHAVIIAAMSINNVVSFLRILNGDDPTVCQFRAPDDPGYFKEPWKYRVPVPDMSMDTIIKKTDLAVKSKEDVLAAYSKNRKGP